MKEKSILPAYISIAFVWFTTQFGGGFASGRQIIDYYVSFGWSAIFTPILAQVIMAFIFYYVLKVSYQKQLVDYHEFTNELYGSTKGIMSPVFEVLYNFTLCIATAVAFATGGATLTKLTGIPYIISTLIIAAAIFLLTIFGASLVRKAATVTSFLIVGGMLCIFIPNIIHFSSELGTNFNTLQANSKPMGSALWKTTLYIAFQVPALGAYVAHAKSLSSLKEVKQSMIWGCIINAVVIMLAVFGIIAVYNIPEVMTEAVPTLVLVQRGVGAALLTPMISILIFLGSLSTGVNFVFGIVGRVGNVLGKNETPEEREKKSTVRNAVVALVYVIITFCIAQFGLIPLVNKGYSYCGYVAIVAVIIPILVKWAGEIFFNKQSNQKQSF